MVHSPVHLGDHDVPALRGLAPVQTIDKYIGGGILMFVGDPETCGVRDDALAAVKMALAMQKRLLRVPSLGSEEGDLQALHQALSGLEADGIVAGAIASDYQRDRINGVCETLGLKLYSPLWRKEQGMLMRDMVEAGIEAMVVAVSAEGLGNEWLGRTLDAEAVKQLELLSARAGVNVSGEGGEYETLVTDSPMHDSCLEIVEAEREVTRDGGRLVVSPFFSCG